MKAQALQTSAASETAHELTALLLGFLRARGARANFSVLGEWLTPLLPPGVVLDKVIPSEPLPAPSLREIAYFFRAFVDPSARAKSGAVYTPPAFAAQLVAPRLEELPFAMVPTIFDPACGSGVFLLAAAEKYFERHPGAARTIRSRATFIASSIFGVDQSERAVATAQFLLQLLCLPDGLTTLPTHNELPRFQHNIIVGNTLIGPPRQQELFAPANEVEQNSLDLDVALRPRGSGRGFDVVIGNPPYGLSRNEQISPEENKALRERYSEVLSGRVNKYLLFMARGFELLAPGGTLSLVVPNSWLGIREASGIRELLFKNRALHEITVLQTSPFPREAVETVTFVARKGKPAIEVIIKHQKTFLDAPHFISKLDYFDWAEEADRMIPSTWTAALPELLKHLGVVSRPLEELAHLFKPRIALQVYALGRGVPAQSKETVKQHPFHYPELRDPANDIPYIEGAAVRRFSVSAATQQLHYGPWMAEFQPRERFQGPRVLVREVLHALPFLITAAVTDRPCTYNRSILHIAALGHDGLTDAYALAALLSSRIGSLWLLARGRKAQRQLFPKILLDDLLRFPVPKEFSTVKHALAAAARELGQADLPDEQRAAAEVRLGELVAQAYGLEEKHWQIADEYLAFAAIS